MTPEALDAAIRAGDAATCRRLGALPEAERRRLAPTAMRQLTMLHDDRGRGQPDRERARAAAEIAVLWTATFSELQLLGWRAANIADPVHEVLGARRPEWIERWADWIAAERPWQWLTVRRLVREGLCPRPEGEAYILAMIEFGRTFREGGPAGLLAQDPDLLEHEVWRLFEIEGGGDRSLAACDKYGADGWRNALVELSHRGTLSRERLLACSLDALERDFAPFRAGWFSRFHEALAPDPRERAALAERYLALLHSHVPPTVSFALKALAVLEKRDCLPGPAFLGHAAPALAAREKGTVRLVLRLLEGAAARRPELGAAAAALAAEALLHEAPDVQETALGVIAKLAAQPDPELACILRSRREGLAPSIRPRLDSLLGAPVPPPAAPAGPARGGPPAGLVPAADLGLERRARAVPEPWASLAGVPAALDALISGADPPPPVNPAAPGIPDLDPDARIHPIASVDELIDTLASVLENNGPPDDLERALDGVARLAAARPAEFERRTGPLRKRAQALLKRTDTPPFEGFEPRDWMCGVALAWTTGQAPPRGRSGPALRGFLIERCREVAARAAAGRPASLLAAPTHAGGRIEPGALAARLRLRAHDELDGADTAQALLRLASQGRRAALESAGDLPEEAGRAFRHALGGAGELPGQDASLWIAAARARRAGADDVAVESRHPGLGPDAGRACRASLRSRQEQHGPYVYVLWYLERDPALPGRLDVLLPSVLHHESDPEDSSAATAWAASIWPCFREAWFARGVHLLANNLDWPEAEWANRIYLEPLLDPDTPLSGLGGVLLALGLAAKEPGESGLASDALIAALDDGRLDGNSLGTHLAALLTLPVRAARWAQTLGAAARVSPLHADAARAGMEGALRGEPPDRPGEMAAFLELLHELCVESGRPIAAPAARQYLDRFPGAGKAARLATRLLALEARPDPERRRAAAERALVGRIERAERWRRWSRE